MKGNVKRILIGILALLFLFAIILIISKTDSERSKEDENPDHVTYVYDSYYYDSESGYDSVARAITMKSDASFNGEFGFRGEKYTDYYIFKVKPNKYDSIDIAMVNADSTVLLCLPEYLNPEYICFTTATPSHPYWNDEFDKYINERPMCQFHGEGRVLTTYKKMFFPLDKGEIAILRYYSNREVHRIPIDSVSYGKFYESLQ